MNRSKRNEVRTYIVFSTVHFVVKAKFEKMQVIIPRPYNDFRVWFLMVSFYVSPPWVWGSDDCTLLYMICNKKWIRCDLTFNKTMACWEVYTLHHLMVVKVL